MNRSYSLFATVPLLLVLGLVFIAPARGELKTIKKDKTAAKSNRNPVGGDAPGFDVFTLGYDKEKLSSADLYGKKPVVLSFWATWCLPCLREMPVLNELYKLHGEEVVIIGISLDRTTDPMADLTKVHEFIEERGIDYPIAMDAEDIYSDRFHVVSIPKLVFVDLQGNISGEVSGFETADRLRDDFYVGTGLKRPANK